jgi:starch phosphorylase
MRNALLEVTPVIPDALSRLPELAGNLFFSWHRPTRALFEDLDPELWKQADGNPRLVLRCVGQKALTLAAEDTTYLARYGNALKALTRTSQRLLLPEMRRSLRTSARSMDFTRASRSIRAASAY